MLVDIFIISDFMLLIGMWFESFLEIMFFLYFFYEIFGYVVFVGCGLMVLLVLVNVYFFLKLFKVIEDYMKFNDDWIKFLLEVINGIKVCNVDGLFNNIKFLVKIYFIFVRVCSIRSFFGIIEYFLIYYWFIFWFYFKFKVIVWRISFNGNRFKVCNL